MNRSAHILSLLFCIAAAFPLTGCTRFDVLNATIRSGVYRRTTDIAYGGVSRQKLDVYVPRDHASAPRRVVVFFYGGDWQAGRKGDYRFVAEALASRGFIAVMPDYRLYPEVTFPTFVEDGALAVRWAHDHVAKFGGDPDRLYLMGHSAGAHIAALLTLDARYLEAAGVDRAAIRGTAALSGPYDFIPPPDDKAAFGMARDQQTTDPNMEPIHFADGHAPPMVLVHGLKDTTVEPGNADRLAAKITAAGGEVTQVTYPDRAHVGVVLSLAAPFRRLAPVLDDVTRFFETH